MESNKRAFYILLAGVIIFVASLIVFAVSQRTTASYSSDELEECKTLQYNGEGKINMVFLGDLEDSQKYFESFFESYPLNEHKDDFNVYYLESKPECELYRNVALFCHSKQLIRKAAACPNDVIVALEKKSPRIRSSAYLNVISINSNHAPSVLLHEFGHAFANFAEEYDAKVSPPRNSPNCVKQCPEEFDLETDGCFEVCSDSSHIRSVESGVMRTLSPKDKEVPFGLFNSLTIKSLIHERTSSESNKVTGNQVLDNSLSCKDSSFILYTREENKKEVFPGCSSSNGYGPSAYEVKDQEEVILSGGVNPVLFNEALSEEPGAGEGELYGEPVYDFYESLTISLPNTDEIGESNLVIYDGNNEVLEEIELYDSGARPC